MKYYCIGNGIKLAELHVPTLLSGNLHLRGEPKYRKLPLTPDRMLEAFEHSEELVFCKSLEDANKLRHSKIIVGYSNANFFAEAVAPGYPLSDLAIYEVEVDENIEGNFTNLNETSGEQLKKLVAPHLYSLSEGMKNLAALPSIEIFSAKKSELNIKLLSCHYLSPVDGHEEITLQCQHNCRL
ncbi:MAG: hypothetical protein Q8R83_00585 [Legionellaceae bacterium]|nr:hypothetical protein [Legionellaceae bacterium]